MGETAKVRALLRVARENLNASDYLRLTQFVLHDAHLLSGYDFDVQNTEETMEVIGEVLTFVHATYGATLTSLKAGTDRDSDVGRPQMEEETDLYRLLLFLEAEGVLPIEDLLILAFLSVGTGGTTALIAKPFREYSHTEDLLALLQAFRSVCDVWKVSTHQGHNWQLVTDASHAPSEELGLDEFDVFRLRCLVLRGDVTLVAACALYDDGHDLIELQDTLVRLVRSARITEDTSLPHSPFILHCFHFLRAHTTPLAVGLHDMWYNSAFPWLTRSGAQSVTSSLAVSTSAVASSSRSTEPLHFVTTLLAGGAITSTQHSFMLRLASSVGSGVLDAAWTVYRESWGSSLANELSAYRDLCDTVTRVLQHYDPAVVFAPLIEDVRDQGFLSVGEGEHLLGLLKRQDAALLALCQRLHTPLDISAFVRALIGIASTWRRCLLDNQTARSMKLISVALSPSEYQFLQYCVLSALAPRAAPSASSSPPAASVSTASNSSASSGASFLSPSGFEHYRTGLEKPYRLFHDATLSSMNGHSSTTVVAGSVWEPTLSFVWEAERRERHSICVALGTSVLSWCLRPMEPEVLLLEARREVDDAARVMAWRVPRLVHASLEAMVTDGLLSTQEQSRILEFGEAELTERAGMEWLLAFDHRSWMRFVLEHAARASAIGALSVNGSHADLLRLIDSLVRTVPAHDTHIAWSAGEYLKAEVLASNPVLLAAFELYATDGGSPTKVSNAWAELWDTLGALLSRRMGTGAQLVTFASHRRECIDVLRSNQFLQPAECLYLHTLLAKGDVTIDAIFSVFQETGDALELQESLTCLAKRWYRSTPALGFLEQCRAAGIFTWAEEQLMHTLLLKGDQSATEAHAQYEQLTTPPLSAVSGATTTLSASTASVSAQSSARSAASTHSAVNGATDGARVGSAAFASPVPARKRASRTSSPIAPAPLDASVPGSDLQPASSLTVEATSLSESTKQADVLQSPVLSDKEALEHASRGVVRVLEEHYVRNSSLLAAQATSIVIALQQARRLTNVSARHLLQMASEYHPVLFAALAEYDLDLSEGSKGSAGASSSRHEVEDTLVRLSVRGLRAAQLSSEVNDLAQLILQDMRVLHTLTPAGWEWLQSILAATADERAELLPHQHQILHWVRQYRDHGNLMLLSEQLVEFSHSWRSVLELNPLVGVLQHLFATGFISREALDLLEYLVFNGDEVLHAAWAVFESAATSGIASTSTWYHWSEWLETLGHVLTKHLGVQPTLRAGSNLLQLVVQELRNEGLVTHAELEQLFNRFKSDDPVLDAVMINYQESFNMSDFCDSLLHLAHQPRNALQLASRRALGYLKTAHIVTDVQQDQLDSSLTAPNSALRHAFDVFWTNVHHPHKQRSEWDRSTLFSSSSSFGAWLELWASVNGCITAHVLADETLLDEELVMEAHSLDARDRLAVVCATVSNRLPASDAAFLQAMVSSYQGDLFDGDYDDESILPELERGETERICLTLEAALSLYMETGALAELHDTIAAVARRWRRAEVTTVVSLSYLRTLVYVHVLTAAEVDIVESHLASREDAVVTAFDLFWSNPRHPDAESYLLTTLFDLLHTHYELHVVQGQGSSAWLKASQAERLLYTDHSVNAADRAHLRLLLRRGDPVVCAALSLSMSTESQADKTSEAECLDTLVRCARGWRHPPYVRRALALFRLMHTERLLTGSDVERLECLMVDAPPEFFVEFDRMLIREQPTSGSRRGVVPGVVQFVQHMLAQQKRHLFQRYRPTIDYAIDQDPWLSTPATRARLHHYVDKETEVLYAALVQLDDRGDLQDFMDTLLSVTRTGPDGAVSTSEQFLLHQAHVLHKKAAITPLEYYGLCGMIRTGNEISLDAALAEFYEAHSLGVEHQQHALGELVDTLLHLAAKWRYRSNLHAYLDGLFLLQKAGVILYREREVLEVMFVLESGGESELLQIFSKHFHGVQSVLQEPLLSLILLHLEEHTNLRFHQLRPEALYYIGLLNGSALGAAEHHFLLDLVNQTSPASSSNASPSGVTDMDRDDRAAVNDPLDTCSAVVFASVAEAVSQRDTTEAERVQSQAECLDTLVRLAMRWPQFLSHFAQGLLHCVTVDLSNAFSSTELDELRLMVYQDHSSLRWHYSKYLLARDSDGPISSQTTFVSNVKQFLAESRWSQHEQKVSLAVNCIETLKASHRLSRAGVDYLSWLLHHRSVDLLRSLGSVPSVSGSQQRKANRRHTYEHYCEVLIATANSWRQTHVDDTGRALLVLAEYLLAHHTVDAAMAETMEWLVYTENIVLSAAYDVYRDSAFSRLGWLDFYDTLRHLRAADVEGQQDASAPTSEPPVTPTEQADQAELVPQSSSFTSLLLDEHHVLERVIDTAFEDGLVTVPMYYHLKSLASADDVVLEAAFAEYRDTGDVMEFSETLQHLGSTWKRSVGSVQQDLLIYVGALKAKRLLSSFEAGVLEAQIYVDPEALLLPSTGHTKGDGARGLYGSMISILEQFTTQFFEHYGNALVEFVASLRTRYSLLLPSALYVHLSGLARARDPVLIACFAEFSRTDDEEDLLDSVLRLGRRWESRLPHGLLPALQSLQQARILTHGELDSVCLAAYNEDPVLLAAWEWFDSVIEPTLAERYQRQAEQDFIDTVRRVAIREYRRLAAEKAWLAEHFLVTLDLTESDDSFTDEDKWCLRCLQQTQDPVLLAAFAEFSDSQDSHELLDTVRKLAQRRRLFSMQSLSALLKSGLEERVDGAANLTPSCHQRVHDALLHHEDLNKAYTRFQDNLDPHDFHEVLTKVAAPLIAEESSVMDTLSSLCLNRWISVPDFDRLQHLPPLAHESLRSAYRQYRQSIEGSPVEETTALIRFCKTLGRILQFAHPKRTDMELQGVTRRRSASDQPVLATPRRTRSNSLKAWGAKREGVK